MTLFELELHLEEAVLAGLEEKFGHKKLEWIIQHLPSYIIYDRRYPRDKFERVLSLDQLVDTGFLLPSDSAELEATSQSNDTVRAYYESLTMRQLLIVSLLRDGFSQPEIAEFLGHKNTAVVRYQKHLAKMKWLALLSP